MTNTNKKVTVNGVDIRDFEIYNNSLYPIDNFISELGKAIGAELPLADEMSNDSRYIILDGSGLIVDEYSITINGGNVVLHGSRDSLIHAIKLFTGDFLMKRDDNYDLTETDSISGSIGKKTIYTKEQLMQLMTDVYNDKNVLIIGEEMQGRQNTCVADCINMFVEATGEDPGIIGLDLACYGIDLTKKTDVQWSAFICDIVEHCANGGIVTMSSHFENPSGNVRKSSPCRGVLGYENSREAYEKGFVDLITEGTEYNTFFRRELETDARFLKALGDNGVPVIWRPLHETNGNWFWFCTVQDSYALDPSCLVNLWRYIYDLYTKELGLTNLLWNYTPIVSANVDDKPGYLMSTTYLYPGDEYCDMVGVDWYTTGKHEIANGDNYKRLLARSHKIGAIAEFGPTGDKLAEKMSDQSALYNSMDAYRDLTKLRDMDLSFVYLLTWGGRWGFKPMGKGKEFMQSDM